MKRVRLIIWDEVPMQSRFLYEAVDRTLRDLLDRDDQPFGGFLLPGVEISNRHYL
jgi:hypothetical protein